MTNGMHSLLFLLALLKFCMMCLVTYSYLPIPPCKIPPFLPILIYIFFFPSPSSPVCVAHIFLGVLLSTDHFQFSRCYTLKENYHSFSQQLPSANSSLARGGTSCLEILGFGLSWGCTGIVYSVITAVNFYVQLASCVLKVLFPCSHSLVLLKS